MNTENPGLSSLENSRSDTVALIVSDITNPFFVEIIPAIEQRLGIEGFVVFVGNTSEDRKREERLLAKIREFPPDGVLICPALGDVESSAGAPTLAGRLPIVAFARRAPGLDYAGVDNAQAAQLAVEHLCQIGYLLLIEFPLSGEGSWRQPSEYFPQKITCQYVGSIYLKVDRSTRANRRCPSFGL